MTSLQSLACMWLLKISTFYPVLRIQFFNTLSEIDIWLSLQVFHSCFYLPHYRGFRHLFRRPRPFSGTRGDCLRNCTECWVGSTHNVTLTVPEP